MVPTSSLGQDLNFRIADLDPSEFEEDQSLIEGVVDMISQLVTALKPLLKYVDIPMKTLNGQHIRGIVVIAADGWELILTRSGDFIRCIVNTPIRMENEEKSSEIALSEFRVGAVIEGLRKVFNEASDKRRKHLASVEKRSEMLAKMVEVMEAF